MADPVRTKVVTAVSASNPNQQTALSTFNTNMAAAIATAAPLATYPVGSNSQSTTVGAPTDPANIVTVGNMTAIFDGTNYVYASYITYIKFV